jgi:hypothetical protein
MLLSCAVYARSDEEVSQLGNLSNQTQDEKQTYESFHHLGQLPAAIVGSLLVEKYR